MNHSKLKNLGCAFALMGAAAAELYHLIYSTAVDERELIVRGGAAEIALWVLTFCALGGAAFFGLKIRFKRNGNPPALGSFLYACGVVTLLLEPLKGPATLVMVYRCMVVASALSLAASAALRLLGKKQYFLLDVFPCILAGLHTVECYQTWSEMPLLLDYVFGVGAVLCILLFAYHKLDMRADMPMKGTYVFAALAGIFFCVTAAAGAAFQLYFLSAAVWMLCMLFVPEAGEE